MAVATVLALFKIHRKHFFAAFASGAISNFLLNEIVKLAVNRPRPYEVLPVHNLLGTHEFGAAFYSGHTAIMFSFAFSFYKTKYFWPFVVWALVCSFARVFVGVHYPLDIIAGIAVAAGVSWTIRRLFKKHFLR